MTWKVKTVSSKVLDDYAAMNPMAAKAFGFHHIHAGEILVWSGLKGKARRKTIVHEEVEAKLMKRGLPYWKAHEAALKAEKKVK